MMQSSNLNYSKQSDLVWAGREEVSVAFVIFFGGKLTCSMGSALRLSVDIVGTTSVVSVRATARDFEKCISAA